MAKQRITLFLIDDVADILTAQAERRGLRPSAYAAQLLFDILVEGKSPAHSQFAKHAAEAKASPEGRKAGRPTDDAPNEPLPPCPYLTYEESMDQYVWDAVAAQREGLTPARFAKKYGRNIHTGAEL